MFQRLAITSALLLLAPVVLAPTARAQGGFGQAEALIQQAREQGLVYLNSKDERAKKTAKNNLEQAEKSLKEELKRSPACEKCHELLTAAHFYRAYFGFERSYEDCVKAAAAGLAAFPVNGRIAFFKGYAHYNSREYAEANKSLRQALMSADPQAAAQIQQVLQDSQQRFLTDWNRQADYYRSKESRIETMYNFQPVTVFQVTPEWEMQLGGQGFAALTANAPRVADAEIQAYLEGLTTRLLSKSPGSPFRYQITVVNSPEVNAVTPPGHIIVYTGLLAFAENEAQLAGVLAHELAHNYAHHQARAVIKNYYAQSAANALLRAVNPQNQTAQIFAQLGANLGVNLIMRAYSRFEEREADLYGAHIMYNAGYSPTDASSFFLKMAKANPKQPVRFLSTHPPLLDRADYLADYLDSFPAEGREFRVDSEEFKKIKARLAPAQQQPAGPGRGALPPR
jgi:Zn-dependent protease with chaperone function